MHKSLHGVKIKVTVVSLAISFPDTFAIKSILTEGCMYTQGKVLRQICWWGGGRQCKMIDQEEDKDMEDCPLIKV